MSRLSSVFNLIVFIILMAAVSSVCNAMEGWTSQPSGTMAWLRSVYFLNEKQGWVVGSKGALLTTNNGGRSWQLQRRPTEDSIQDIYFTDANTGWLVCERSIYLLKTKDEPRSYLLKTTNGGITWRRINVIGKDSNIRLVRAVFVDNFNGWTFGEEGAFYVTYDGGASWTRQRLPTRFLILGGALLDVDMGWLVGAGATLLQTSDGGSSWRERKANVPINRLNAIFFVDQQHGWAVGAEGQIIHTVNGGITWKAQLSPVKANFLDVKFVDAREGWAVGADGVIVHSNDGGANWKLEPSDTRHPLERVFFVGPNHGWAVGFGGTIISYARNAASQRTN